ncbi:MAG: sialidase family protein [Firmicutes bacterium]|nr:sialidase family protein [Bacillota bacterium]
MAAPKVSLELNPGPSNPRNSEGAIAELADGRLLLAYTRFYAGSADYAPAEIACRFSSDLGATWDDKNRIVVANEGDSNVMSVSLLRLARGGLGLFYLVKNSWGDCMLYLRKSFDEGQTWGERTCCAPDPGYYVVNNDRVIQLSTGRLIVPAAWHHCVDGTRETHRSQAKAMAFLSDDRTPLVTAISYDEGRAWRNHRPLETDLDGCYCYTSMTFVGDRVLLSYCAGDSRVGGLNRLRVRGFNIDWLFIGPGSPGSAGSAGQWRASIWLS